VGATKIVITGGPSTGKSAIITELLKRGYDCLEEISRQVILNARKDGVDQLFLKDPLKFSSLLLNGRVQQYEIANSLRSSAVFIDRGIPDVLAYLDYIGITYPKLFDKACENHIYDYVLILAPWQEIYTQDNERYESFEQAIEIHHHLLNTYRNYHYNLIDIPFDTVEKRVDYILDVLNKV
jgi:predicted ATPase